VLGFVGVFWKYDYDGGREEVITLTMLLSWLFFFSFFFFFLSLFVRSAPRWGRLGIGVRFLVELGTNMSVTAEDLAVVSRHLG